MACVALDGFYEIWNQVGAALILVLYLAPRGLNFFVFAYEFIVNRYCKYRKRNRRNH